jgi:hypothetical protein
MPQHMAKTEDEEPPRGISETEQRTDVQNCCYCTSRVYFELTLVTKKYFAINSKNLYSYKFSWYNVVFGV